MFRWLRREPELVVPEAPQPEPMPEMYTAPKILVNEEIDDGLTPLQREMRSFGACEMEHKWPSQIAQEFVDYQRLHGFCDYPYLAADLDQAIADFCEDMGYLSQPPQIMREAIQGIPGVGAPRRERLTKGNPKHRFIMQRLAKRGSTNDRPVLYYISPRVPTSAYGQARPWYDTAEPPVDAAAPPAAKRKKRTSQPRGGHKAPTLYPDQGQAIGHAGGSIENEWEIPDRRYA